MAITNAQRQTVATRAGDCCEYCRLPRSGSKLPFHVDHIRPLKHDGTDETDNLCLACYQCNGHKGTNIAGYDPQTDDITALFHPRKDRWEAHFRLADDYQIVGITAVGRTTVNVLRLNEMATLQNRQLLAALNEYPCGKNEPDGA